MYSPTNRLRRILSTTGIAGYGHFRAATKQ